MTLTMFGYTKAQRAQANTRAYELAAYGRPYMAHYKGVGITILWHGWEHGRDGARRPLPLTGEHCEGSSYMP